MADTVNLPDTSPRKMLASWANEQDDWVRDITTRVMASNAPLGTDEIDQVLKRFMSEKGLEQDSFTLVPQIELQDVAAAAEDVLELRQLFNVSGVNALAAGQSIDFDPCLTVLFGQNGAGKTGYARILKKLAAVRTAEDVLPNAHSHTPQVSPSAQVTYAINNSETTVAWKNTSGEAPFTRISIFDSPAVHLHVDDELNYLYTPGELALFTYVSAAIRVIQEKLEVEAKRLRPNSSPFLIHFKRGTYVYPLVEAVGATSELSVLEKMADTCERGENRVQTLTAEVEALRGGNVEARFAVVRQEHDRLTVLSRLGKNLTQFDEDDYNASLTQFEELRIEHNRARRQLVEPGDLPGDPDDAWASFIAEGDRYRRHLDAKTYPADGDSCLYCRQALSSEALELVRRYRAFLDDELARRVVAAEGVYNRSRLVLKDPTIDIVREHARQTGEAEPRPSYHDSFSSLVVELEKVLSAIEARTSIETPQLAVLMPKFVDAVASRIVVVEPLLADLVKQREDRVEALRSRELELNELVARRTLGRHLPAMTTFIADAKASARMDALARSMSSGLMRSLTIVSKTASEDLVNRNFERLFEEECVALRAPNVALEFQGRRGRAERKKVVARYKPSAILSEGEQKVLAIADFLAESRMSGVKAPIIFDDPVTSLDYGRLREVAERISSLGETHQVVVFTHNIFFASTLLSLRTTKKLKCKFYEVKSEDADKGIVMPDYEPRQDNPAEIGKRINALIQAIRSSDPVTHDALIEGSYGLMRSWCEAFVEQELLQNVSQRFRINVMMAGLEKIKLERFDATVTALIPMFDRCSRFMPGHSQPIEQLNVRPSFSELQEDWKKLQEVRSSHIG